MDYSSFFYCGYLDLRAVDCIENRFYEIEGFFFNGLTKGKGTSYKWVRAVMPSFQIDLSSRLKASSSVVARCYRMLKDIFKIFFSLPELYIYV